MNKEHKNNINKNKKELLEKYPNAKVILTERDAEKWYNTCLNGIYEASKPLGLPMKIILFFVPKLRKIRKLTDEVIWKATFSNSFANKEKTIEYYNQRVKEIKETIPQNQLLCFKVEDGLFLLYYLIYLFQLFF